MNIPKDKLDRILLAAVQAPSGDNAQPWRFQVKGNVIRLFNAAEATVAPFINYKQSLNLIALGAALTNLCIAAESEAFATEVKLFPDSSNDDLVAEILLKEGNSAGNELAPYIPKRASNRRKYELTAIPSDTLLTLQELAKPLGARVSFVTEKKDIDTIAHAISGGEKVALENKDLHDYLFEHVTWSRKDELARHGFYIKTFEFKPPQEFIFKLFKNWNILSFFKKFGITDFIAKDMEGVYSSSGAFGAILMRSSSREEFLKTGMLLERVWLAATKLGLSLQPTTGIHFLELPIREGVTDGLSPFHQDLVKERYQILSDTFKLGQEESIAFAFRVGFAQPPSARTTRAKPIVEILAV
jgi:hypothetical protein